MVHQHVGQLGLLREQRGRGVELDGRRGAWPYIADGTTCDLLAEQLGTDSSRAPSRWRPPRSSRRGARARPRRRATTACRRRRPPRRTRRASDRAPAPRSSPAACWWGWRAARSTSRPRARARPTMASPIEPPPITRTRSPGVERRPVPDRVAPTASGSTSAPNSGSTPSGSGTRQLRSTITSSARPPSTETPCSRVPPVRHSWVSPARQRSQVAAPHVGLHRDRGAVVEDAGELVAERDRQVPRREVQIGARRCRTTAPARAPDRSRARARSGSTSTTATPPSPDARTARTAGVLQAHGSGRVRAATHYGVGRTIAASGLRAWSDDGGSRFRRQGGDRHRRGRRPRAGALAAARRAGARSWSSTTSAARSTAPAATPGPGQQVVDEIKAAGGEAVLDTNSVATPEGGAGDRADRARQLRAHRHRREQRRHPARQELPQHDARPRRSGARRPPPRRVLRDPAGVGAHARAVVRAHRRHRVVGRALRQLRPGQLRRRQDGARRPRPRARPGGRALQHQGQRDRADGGYPHDPRDLRRRAGRQAGAGARVAGGGVARARGLPGVGPHLLGRWWARRPRVRRRGPGVPRARTRR